MNGLPYYKAYPRDFLEGTIGMPFEVKCAYRVIIDLIYMQGGTLPDDARYISGHLGCSLRKWKTIRAALVEMDKLQVSRGFLTNYRAEKEIETLSKLQDKMAENARHPRKNKDLQEQLQSHTEPEPYIKERAKALCKKGTRIGDDWLLPKSCGEWAIGEGLSVDQIRLEADKFRDYWISQPGQKGVKRDWRATWRNWIRHAMARGRPSTDGRIGKEDRMRQIITAAAAGTTERDWG